MDRTSRAALQAELTALSRGDREAFDPLFRRLWPLLRGFAARALPAGEAEDAAQESLIRIFRRASEFDVRRDALAWILGVTAWQIRTHRRRAFRRRESAIEEAPEAASPAVSPESAVIDDELAEAVARALAELPASDAETLRAYSRGERPDLPAPTFRKRVERALKRLRLRWRVDHGGV